MIHDLKRSDASQLLALNNAHAKETSELDLSSLNTLLDMAWYARGVDGGVTALLIAFDHNAAYQNPNFAWFKAACESFVYIDRVIVAESAWGRGIARTLYLDLFAVAAQAGHRRVVCEVNTAPANPGSIAFHERMGFGAVGEASIHGGAKSVRYFAKLLTASQPPS